MLVPAVQMAIGFRAPLLPRFVRRRRIGVSAIRAMGNKAIHWIEWAEQFVKPRWLPLTKPPMPMIIGVIAVGLSLFVMAPLPLSNLLPALALASLALGLVARDGLMIGIGLLLAFAALAVGFIVALLAYEALMLFVDQPPG